MSSIDDSANGTEQTRYHRNPSEDCGRAVRLVCSYAHDADDARELCTVLGLNPRDGRRKTPPCPGRGEALPGNPSGNPFKDQDYGWTTRIFSAGDCTG